MEYSERSFSNLYDLIICMTKAVDLVSLEIADHHQQVAYLSYHIADAMRLPADEKRRLVIAALLHDIGAIAADTGLSFFDKEDDRVNEHAFIGARLFADSPILGRVASVIKFHHIAWAGGEGRSYGGEAVSPLAHILHLADRIAVHVDRDACIISQQNAIREGVVARRGTVFEPDAVDAFLEICDKEALWLDLAYQPTVENVSASLGVEDIRLTLDEVVDLTQIFSRIIDFRSPFTAMHSAGVAATATELAGLSGFSEDECRMMSIAGNLHDIGKLAIPREILEKQDRLEPSEFDIIRAHSFYTYRLLRPIAGFGAITQWAAYHHEKLNGRGYPFHLVARELSLGARIMAVADIFTAITEDRPYRAGMPREQTVSVLRRMAESGGISPQLCDLLFANYDLIDHQRRTAAELAMENYRALLPGRTRAPLGGTPDPAPVPAGAKQI